MSEKAIGFLGMLRDMSQAQFQTAYLQNTEHHWQTMPRENLEAWQSEAERRGLAHNLEDKIGELSLPSARWLDLRSEPEDPTPTETPSTSTTSTSTSETTVRLASGQEMSLEEARAAWENAKKNLLPVARMLGLVPRERIQSDYALTVAMESSLPKASTGSGETSTGEERAVAVALAKPRDLPSTGTSAGVPSDAGSGFAVEAYLRLPLQGKRDAFIHDGMLYVRRSIFRGWLNRFSSGRCCKPQRNGETSHASDCWVQRDAVR